MSVRLAAKISQAYPLSSNASNVQIKRLLLDHEGATHQLAQFVDPLADITPPSLFLLLPDHTITPTPEP